MTKTGYAEDASELAVFAENDSSLYPTKKAAIRSLCGLVNDGDYDRIVGSQRFDQFTMIAAQKYVREFSPNSAWRLMFPMKVRREVAEYFRDQFETQYDLDQWNDINPIQACHGRPLTVPKE